MRPYDRSPSRTYGCPSMTTTHNFDQCSPTSGSVVIIWTVLASRNTAGSHPGTALSSAHAAVASATDKTNESSARLAIRQIFILVGIISTRVTLATVQRIVHCARCRLSWRTLAWSNANGIPSNFHRREDG